MTRGRLKHVAGALAAAVTIAATLVTAGPASAVDTPIAIDTTAIPFGDVEVGSTAQMTVILLNAGGAPFGPINMFGGAPFTPQFGATQNCQGVTLPSGGSCQISYTFTPDTPGPSSDSSRFTISPTSSQADGEDFEVGLSGSGCQMGACAATTTTTTSTAPAPAVEPTAGAGTPMAPPGQNPAPAPAQGQPAVVPAGDLPQTAPGDEAVAAPTDDTSEGARVLDDGSPSEDDEAAQVEVEGSDDGGTNWILPAVTLLVVVLLAAGAIVLAYRAGRSSGASHRDGPPAHPNP